MSKVKAFLKLDFMSVKHYFKPIAVMFYMLLAVIFTHFFGTLSGGIGYGMTLGTLIMSYNFIVAENCDLDTLYSTLALGKKTIVFGRYLYTLILNSVVLLGSIGCSMIGIFIKTKELPAFSFEVFFSIAVVVALFIFIQSIQMPMFFKLGYTKAKIFSIVPMFFILTIGVTMSSFYKHRENVLIEFLNVIGNFLEKNRIFPVLSVVIFIALSLYISYKISVIFYKKREF
jgi:hypothetical protein